MEGARRQAEAGRERVQLVVALVADEVGEPPAPRRPDGRVDEQAQEATLAVGVKRTGIASGPTMKLDAR